MPDANVSTSQGKEKDGHRSHRERIGNYVVGAEIGRGSFATVFKGYRSKTKAPIAIKAVSRQKLTTKLLENLESEINILKSIHHRNIVALEDCFKNDTHIYLVMEFCSGSDLSIYIKNRGRLATLDFYPKPGTSMAKLDTKEDGKIYWPHPAAGGLDERVTRSFLGQLAQAIKFLRAQDLMHRDIKPQNLLMQPATDTEIADGHPYGVPVLKVADFGFARILPAAAMAETLCGSPLYMAPEILRYEKYDATADLWSVGAVLFEMAVGRPPFRANNHVELLRRIEKGEDRIKFPDEATPTEARGSPLPPVPVSPDIKALIRALLKRKPADRIGFDEFFSSNVWGVDLSESTEDEGTTSLEVSTDSSLNIGASTRLREMIASAERTRDTVPITRGPQPIAADTALNPRPAPSASRQSSLDPVQSTTSASVQNTRLPPRRSEPRYFVGEDIVPPEESTPAAQLPPIPTLASARVDPRPIQTAAQRRVSIGQSQRDQGSLEEAAPLTPPYTGAAASLPRASKGISEGSPLAATPPMTMRHAGKEESALEGSESGVGTDYVVVEKQTVEINALADELDQASRKPTTLARRRSSRTSVVTRPVSAFKPSSKPQENAMIPISYSPPFALGTTPPFAIPPASRQPSTSSPPLTRPPSIPGALNMFPPSGQPTSYGSYGQDAANRFGVSPGSLQTGALARAITNTAIRLIGTSANTAATALARATVKRRPTIIRTSDIDPAEDELLRTVEDMARKAFVLFELADERLLSQSFSTSVRHASSPTPPSLIGTTPPFSAQAAAASASASGRRKSSSGSMNSEVWQLRQQQAAANDAVVLYMKALAFLVQAMDKIKRFWKNRANDDQDPSPELNEMGQWLRSRFNEVFEKIEWAKSRSSDSMLFPDWLVHEKAREMSRQGAVAELSDDLVTAEQGYETSVWLLQALLDETVYESGRIHDDDRVTYEKLLVPIKARLEALRRKLADPQVVPGRHS
ncbi:hypothetical protein IAU60_004984 [Kwoniella sp. DSM 27419]